MLDVWPLCVAAFAAGFVDSVVGGGGLIQLPALFMFLPPAVSGSVPLVFGTNKFSSICGTSMAVVQYARQVPIPWRAVLPAALTALVFSFVGAHLVSRLPEGVVKPSVFVLLLGVALFTTFRKAIGEVHAPRLSGRRELIAGVVTGAGIGLYDGLFGPGTGTFLILAFVGWFGFDFLTSSASAKVVNFSTNLAAVSYFAATGHIAYAYAIPMAVCNVAGATLGSRLAILRGNVLVRRVFLTMIFGMILRFGWDVFGPMIKQGL